MKQPNKTRSFFFAKALIFFCLLSIPTGSTFATTVSYSLVNVLQDNNNQMTGFFDWTYTEGDFENGAGVFTELFIPGHGTDIGALTINFDITKSIEFSLTANVHSGGVNVSLFLDTALTPTQAASLDFSRSTYEIESGGQNGGFISGVISPNVIPVPASLWMFISGIAGLGSFSWHKRYLSKAE